MNESHPHPGGLRPGQPPSLPQRSSSPGVMPKMTVAPDLGRSKDDLSTIALVDDSREAAPAAASKIHAFGVKETHASREYKRQSTLTGNGAVHVKSFHGRLSDEGMQYLDDKINEWLESHPQIEVKFCNTTVGLFDGKIKDLALIVNVWY